MRIIPLIAQLQANSTLIQEIRIAASVNEGLDYQGTLPVVYFVLPEDRGHPDTLDDIAVTQSIHSTLSLVIVAQNLDEALSTEPLEDVRDEIFSALHGFEIDTDHEPVVYLDGAPLSQTRDRVVYLDRFMITQPNRLRVVK